MSKAPATDKKAYHHGDLRKALLDENDRKKAAKRAKLSDGSGA